MAPIKQVKTAAIKSKSFIFSVFCDYAILLKIDAFRVGSFCEDKS